MCNHYCYVHCRTSAFGPGMCRASMIEAVHCQGHRTKPWPRKMWQRRLFEDLPSHPTIGRAAEDLPDDSEEHSTVCSSSDRLHHVVWSVGDDQPREHGGEHEYLKGMGA